MNKVLKVVFANLVAVLSVFIVVNASPAGAKSEPFVNTVQQASFNSGRQIQNLAKPEASNQQANLQFGNKEMKNTIKSNFVTLEFLEDTFYKGELRRVGDRFEVDGSYAKNFIAQNRAVAIETENDSGGNGQSTIDALKEKYSRLTVDQMSKERKDQLVASAYNLGIPTVPDGLKNKDIAQLIYDHVNGRSE